MTKSEMLQMADEVEEQKAVVFNNWFGTFHTPEQFRGIIHTRYDELSLNDRWTASFHPIPLAEAKMVLREKIMEIHDDMERAEREYEALNEVYND